MQPPIDILHLFPRINTMLLSFLSNLPVNDWQRQTVAKKWVIKDVAAHLLDGNLRLISLKRDHWSLPVGTAINNNNDLVNYLNTLNAEWVNATKRLSPQLITGLLEFSDAEVLKIFVSLDPFAPSIYPVSWAGETMSYNWFDIAREYTERWLHQQQIRDAMDNKELLAKELYYPVLNIFMQAWPFTAADYGAAEGTVLKTTITGKGGGEWYLIRTGAQWKLVDNAEAPFAAETIIDGAAAWKLFSKSIRKEDMPDQYEIKGDRQPGEIVLNMISVMA